MSKELTLFQYTQPSLLPGLNLVPKKGEAGNTVGLTLSLMKRKEIAKLAGLPNKGDRLEKHLLELSDAIKTASIGEMAKLASDPNWTGATFRISQSKNGKQRATMSLVTANRETKSITREQLAKALAAMSEDEKVTILDEAEALKRTLAVTDIESEASNAAAPAPAAK